jgi:hypothetical protein
MNYSPTTRPLPSPTDKKVIDARKTYPSGTRVELVKMDDPYTKLRPGDRGTVTHVDDAGGIHIRWDNGEGLAALCNVDKIKKLKDPEQVLQEMREANTVDAIRNEFVPMQLMGLRMENEEKFMQAHKEVQANKFRRFEDAIPTYERIFGRKIEMMPIAEAEKIKAERDKEFERLYNDFKTDQKVLTLAEMKERYPCYYE